MSPAERADLIVDFSAVAVGNYVLGNVGPDEPFGGGYLDLLPSADPATTGQLLQFRVKVRRGLDLSTPAPVPPLACDRGAATATRSADRWH